MSSLAAWGELLFSVEVSFYKASRLFAINTGTNPPTLEAALNVFDSNESLPELLRPKSLVNWQAFWIVSQAIGTMGDVDELVETPNMLLRLNNASTMDEITMLPDDVNGI